MKDYRLSQIELSEIKETHRREKDKKIADKLKAVYLLGSGWEVSKVCEALLLDENTLYRYFSSYKESGIPNLLENQYKGAETKLSLSELEDLERYLEAHPLRTTKQAIEYVEQEFETTYSVSGMNALLKRLGFVFKKPRAVPGKSDADAQKKFIKKYRKIRENMGDEDSLFFMDGVHPHHNPLVQYGWFKKGSKVPLKTNTRYTRINITGAVDIDTHEVVAQEFATLNEESTLDFFEKLRKKKPTGWIYLVLDNASYNDTKRVRAFAKLIGIKLLYLPPYSPNLNLIERLWGQMQREILYNRYYATFDEFRSACMGYLKGLWRKKDMLKNLLTEKFETLPA